MDDNGNRGIGMDVSSRHKPISDTQEKSLGEKQEEAERPIETLPKAKEFKELPKQEGKTVEQLEQELSRERQRAEEYLKQLQYLQADFENYRKRVEKEISEVKQTSNEALVRSLLGVLDELELSIQAAKKTENREGMLTGVEMVLKNLYSTLESQGLSRIEAVGNRFDPMKHEAAERIPDTTYAEGTVIEEIRRGFTFKGRVIRPSMVKVAVKPAANKTLEEKAL